MLDVKEWYYVVEQMIEHVKDGDVYYFKMMFESDEIWAATEVITDRCGYCPQIIPLKGDT